MVTPASLLVLILLQTVVRVEGRCRSIQPSTGCPHSWQTWGVHCYFGDSHSTLGFDQAEAHCQGLSNPGRPAHLASVNSEEENQFVNAYRAASGIEGCWIGYRYDGDFSWTDGTANTGFSKWADGQPNEGIIIGANCTIVYSDSWHLQWCTNLRGFVCKMPRIV